MFGLKGKDHPAYGYQYTKEQRQRRSKYLKENNPMSNPESRAKISRARSGKASRVYDYTITFSNGNQVVVTNLKEWARKNSYTYRYLLRVKNGQQSHHKDIVSIQQHLLEDRQYP